MAIRIRTSQIGRNSLLQIIAFIHREFLNKYYEFKL